MFPFPFKVCLQYRGHILSESIICFPYRIYLVMWHWLLLISDVAMPSKQPLEATTPFAHLRLYLTIGCVSQPMVNQCVRRVGKVVDVRICYLAVSATRC